MSKYNNQFTLESADKQHIELILGEKIRGAASRKASQELHELEVLLATVREQEETFRLNVRDVQLIEHALRERIHALAQANLTGAPGAAHAHNGQIMELEQLLGRLHNQKVWYGQVHHTGVPLTGG